MNTSRILKIITGVLEAILGIPFLGGLIVLANGWTPLVIMFVLHIVTLIFCSKENTSKIGSVTGIITSCLAWIPFLGMLLHILTAVVLLFSIVVSSPRRA